MANERESKDYLKVIKGISQMLQNDDPENDYPISHSMRSDRRYDEGEELGYGAIKNVTIARDQLTDRKVAMAKLRKPDDPENTETFFLEARLTARLQHPNIVPVYDAGYDSEGKAFFTMKPVGGLNLREYIKNFKESKADFQERLEIFIKICDAISYAHSNHVIHRDLKPDNIYLGEYGEVLVGDWGLAKVINEYDNDFELYSSDNKALNTLHGIIKGTPGYMAPEQIDKRLGPSDHLSDIYALGIILFELLTLERPIANTELEEILKETLTGICKVPSTINSSIPEGIESIILKSISLYREDRYQSVKEFVSDIKKFQGGYITSAESRSFIKSFVYLMKRHKAVTALMVLMIIGSVIFITSIFKEKKIAEAERNEAVEQRRIALEQKDLANKARVEREKISKEASPRFLSVAQIDLKEFRFESAANNIRLAVSLDPENLDAIRFLGFYLFI